MILRQVIFDSEIVEQRLLAALLTHHGEKASDGDTELPPSQHNMYSSSGLLPPADPGL
jgi:hypothetical protein